MKRLILSTLFTLAATALSAAISETEAARLGADLTPLGGEKAGNADGSIPAWTGGITTPPAGYTVGDHHPDPFAGEQPLYTVTPGNLGQYQDHLTDGSVALLKAYADYKLIVYPTHRSAANPQRIYDATRKNATTAKLTDGGNGITGSVVGIPFPIPASGLEVIWNHLTRYRGVAAMRYIGQAAPQRNGSYTMVDFVDEFLFNYCRPDISEGDLDNVLIYYKQSIMAPARLAGTITLVHETMDQVKEPRHAWLYNTGRRRVTRAPNVSYDNPGNGSDGQRTSDQFDMFNGAPDRYDWKLVGKKEMLVPYNSYTLHSGKVKYADILQPLHINQNLARYEMHRVWIVDATLKAGTSHLATTDAGLTWLKQWQGENLSDSFLDVLALDSRHVIAVGAYGLFVTTNDGGKTWMRRKISEEDFHLNRLTRGPGGDLYLAGEHGTLLRSPDQGLTWQRIDSPYDGSFYGILPLDARTLVAHGLRGRIYRSVDNGGTWTVVPNDTRVLLATALRLPGGVILFAGQSRAWFISRDDGRTVMPWSVPFTTAVASLLALPDGSILTLGEAGAVLLPKP